MVSKQQTWHCQSDFELMCRKLSVCEVFHRCSSLVLPDYHIEQKYKNEIQ